MEEIEFTDELLKQMPHEALRKIILMLQQDVKQLNKNVELLNEHIKVMNQRTYGRKTEKTSELFEMQQLDLAFNEAEFTEDETVSEPTVENLPKKKKEKGHKENSLKKITNHREVLIELTVEQLNEKYGESKWKKLPYETIVKLEHHPACFEVVTYKIGVYAKNDNETIIRAEKPKELIPGSIATPSLVASIMFGKYVNALPLYRQEQAYKANDVFINRQTMANWTIKVAEKYLKPLWEVFKKEMVDSKLIGADETPCLVNKDGRSAGSKSYMWVYRSDEEKNIVLYDYQKTRKEEHPREFLEAYHGILTTDGYQVYHTLEAKNPDKFIVSGCWEHLKRKFAVEVKAIGKQKAKGTLAEQAALKISNLYHIDNKGKDLTNEERAEYRQNIVKPFVDEFFAWVRDNIKKVPEKSETGTAFKYALNQEKYLRVFLTNPIIPMDNNAAERAIRPFCIGKKNWIFMDTLKGAEASAIIYSIVETAKANNLRLYDYLKYILEELPNYVGAKSEIPPKLLPWAEDLPVELKKTTV